MTFLHQDVLENLSSPCALFPLCYAHALNFACFVHSKNFTLSTTYNDCSYNDCLKLFLYCLYLPLYAKVKYKIVLKYAILLLYWSRIKSLELSIHLPLSFPQFYHMSQCFLLSFETSQVISHICTLILLITSKLIKFFLMYFLYFIP